MAPKDNIGIGGDVIDGTAADVTEETPIERANDAVRRGAQQAQDTVGGGENSQDNFGMEQPVPSSQSQATDNKTTSAPAGNLQPLKLSEDQRVYEPQLQESSSEIPDAITDPYAEYATDDTNYKLSGEAKASHDNDETTVNSTTVTMNIPSSNGEDKPEDRFVQDMIGEFLDQAKFMKKYKFKSIQDKKNDEDIVADFIFQHGNEKFIDALIDIKVYAQYIKEQRQEAEAKKQHDLSKQYYDQYAAFTSENSPYMSLGYILLNILDMLKSDQKPSADQINDKAKQLNDWSVDINLQKIVDAFSEKTIPEEPSADQKDDKIAAPVKKEPSNFFTRIGDWLKNGVDPHEESKKRANQAMSMDEFEARIELYKKQPPLGKSKTRQLRRNKQFLNDTSKDAVTNGRILRDQMGAEAFYAYQVAIGNLSAEEAYDLLPQKAGAAVPKAKTGKKEAVTDGCGNTNCNDPSCATDDKVELPAKEVKSSSPIADMINKDLGADGAEKPTSSEAKAEAVTPTKAEEVTENDADANVTNTDPQATKINDVDAKVVQQKQEPVEDNSYANIMSDHEKKPKMTGSQEWDAYIAKQGEGETSAKVNPYDSILSDHEKKPKMNGSQEWDAHIAKQGEISAKAEAVTPPKAEEVTENDANADVNQGNVVFKSRRTQQAEQSDEPQEENRLSFRRKPDAPELDRRDKNNHRGMDFTM